MNETNTNNQKPSVPKPRKPYNFEEIGWLLGISALGCQTPASVYLAQLRSNLKIKQAPPDPTDDALLERFVAVVHMNASWYWRAVARERVYRLVFIGTSIGLLVALPFLLIWAPTAAVGLTTELTGETVQPEKLSLVMAQVGAGLTGIIGIHKTLGAWLGQRKVIGRFWRTRSQLLDEILSIEEEWAGQATSQPTDGANQHSGITMLKQDFRDDLQQAIVVGRQIVREETEKFFDEYALPDIDLGKSIIDAQGVAGKLIKAFPSPHATKIEAKAALVAASNKAREELSAAQEKVSSIRQEITNTKNDLEGSNNDTAEQKRLSDKEQTLGANLTEAELVVVEKRAAYATALQAAR